MNLKSKLNENEESKKNFIGIKLSNKELLKLKDIMIDIKTRNQSKAIRYSINEVAGAIE
jgi:hypothetical protein